jgi:hypothetical protein
MPELPARHPDHRGSTLSAELRRTLAAASANHRASKNALQIAVCEYIDELRRLGSTQTDALAAVRSFVLEHDADRSGRRSQAGSDEALVAQIAFWCDELWPPPRV